MIRAWLAHAGALMSPAAPVAGKAALERDADLRLRRLREAARERRRPAPRRMRALRAWPGARPRWVDAPAPRAPRAGEAVVHPIAVATCDLDRQLLLGTAPFPMPFHFGHECVAEVLTVGDGVTGVRPGQRVVVPFQISCGACAACRAGHTGNCLSVPPLSMYGFGIGGGHWGGAVSDELLVPFADAMLVPLPDGIEPAAAASVADNVADAHRHVAPHLPALLAADPDAAVLLVGDVDGRTESTASVPLYAGLIARALGARHVHMADARPHVRAQAESLGLHAMPPKALRHHPPAPLVSTPRRPSGDCAAPSSTSRRTAPAAASAACTAPRASRPR